MTMYEAGKIIKINHNIATVKCDKSEQCKSCSSSFCNVKERKFKAINSNDIEIGVGDTVEVYISPGKTILSSFVVLIFPLLMFIAGYILSGKFFNFQTDALKAAGGALGLFLGFILSFLFNMLKKNQHLPAITKKL
jgi:sigma-E factor negative regulatory protein RseC